MKAADYWFMLSIVLSINLTDAMLMVLERLQCCIHDDWENIYTLSYYHHQIGIMNYLPIRSWNKGMRCMSFCIIMQPGTI